MKFLHLLLTLLLSFHSTASLPQHQTNAQGFVTDGSPQNDDAHCVGTVDQRAQCLVARRPECRGYGAKTPAFATACWAPLINLYGDWSHVRMMNILFCESKGDEHAYNPSRHYNLLQTSRWAPSPWSEVEMAHDSYWVPGRYGQWSCTG